VVQTLQKTRPDAMVVVGYGQIIPQSILDVPPLGIINVHGSLLPRYRGAAPIQWAVANGETLTGVTTMRIDAGLDTGEILLKAACPIDLDETAGTLWERLAAMGAHLLVETMDGLARGILNGEPQENELATYAPMLKRDDGLVRWHQPAGVVYNRYRGFQPWPGAWTFFRGARFQLKEMRLANATVQPPGSLYAEGKRLFAACGDGLAVELPRVQQEGKAAVSAEAFLNGAKLLPGERFASAIPADLSPSMPEEESTH